MPAIEPEKFQRGPAAPEIRRTLPDAQAPQAAGLPEAGTGQRMVAEEAAAEGEIWLISI
jgi:hypothetical protein